MSSRYLICAAHNYVAGCPPPTLGDVARLRSFYHYINWDQAYLSGSC